MVASSLIDPVRERRARAALACSIVRLDPFREID
jgi:hypothetical protein